MRHGDQFSSNNSRFRKLGIVVKLSPIYHDPWAWILPLPLFLEGMHTNECVRLRRWKRSLHRGCEGTDGSCPAQPLKSKRLHSSMIPGMERTRCGSKETSVSASETNQTTFDLQPSLYTFRNSHLHCTHTTCVLFRSTSSFHDKDHDFAFVERSSTVIARFFNHFKKAGRQLSSVLIPERKRKHEKGIRGTQRKRRTS